MKKSIGRWLQKIWIERGRPDEFRVTNIMDIRTLSQSGYCCSPTLAIIVNRPIEIKEDFPDRFYNIKVKVECYSLNFWVVLGSCTWIGIQKSLDSELKKRELYYMLKEEVV